MSAEARGAVLVLIVGWLMAHAAIVAVTVIGVAIVAMPVIERLVIRSSKTPARPAVASRRAKAEVKAA